LTKNGAEPHARTRDPRVHSLRRRRELDYNNAQVTAAKAAAERKRFPGYVSSEDWFHLSAAALQRGGRVVRPGVVEWNAAGKCESPFTRTITGLVTDLYGKVEARERGTRTRYLDMQVPCRRCKTCLWNKARHWMHRASLECEIANRTWMMTLTFHPAVRAQMTLRARASAGEEAWTEASREGRANMLAKEAQKYVTLWLKRVRSEAGPGLRILSVTERHKDGFPHCHLLVHEFGTTVRHATLTRQWVYGFSNAKLVEDTVEGAKYVAKYLAKDPISRVRASVGYGQTPGQQRPRT